MTTIKLIKKHLPHYNSAQRKIVAADFEYASKASGKPIIELIKEAEEKINQQQIKDSVLLLHKIIATGLLIEINDTLEGTLFHNYFCKITKNIGKLFMNAQYKLYHINYNNLLGVNLNDTSFLVENVNKGVKILAKAMRTDTVETFEIIEAMQEDEVLQKRIAGLYKQHLKRLSTKKDA